MQRTLLIVASKLGYQTRAFADAAGQLGVQVAYATDRCHVLADPWNDQALPLHFEHPDGAADQIAEFARATPLAGMIALGDRAAPVAARACAALGLPFHTPNATDVCADKYRSRIVLRDAAIPVPAFTRVPLDCSGIKADFPFPWVLKPLLLSGSRGVIRANTSEEARAAFDRVRALLRSPEVRVLRDEKAEFIQIEQYVGGTEIAVEAVVERGQLKLLAIFDKPDPLSGPFFEETIYLTPSRLSERVQRKVGVTLHECVAALGLWHGPVHAEMRIEAGPRGDPKIWVMEVAARCIGGLCARSLRFNAADADGVSLECLLIHLALSDPMAEFQRERHASGVMMIPIPAEGIYVDCLGLEDALLLPHIEAIEITAKLGQRLIPLPEGSSYLGFIFARADQPEHVEQVLRSAHSKLRFTITPTLPVLAAR